MADDMESVEKDLRQNTTDRPIEQCFKCVACTKIKFEHASLVLPCLHHVCSKGSCLEQCSKNDTGTPVCPCCRHKFDKSNLITEDLSKNGKLRKVVAESVDCTFCSRKVASEKYCAQCHEFLCTSCVENHVYMKITNNHVLSTIEDGQVVLDAKHAMEARSCKRHQIDKSLYCVTCDVQLCSDCAKAEHAEHEIREFDELIEGIREMLRTGVEQFTLYRQKSEEAYRELTDKARHVLAEQKLALIKGARQQLLRVVTVLMQRELELRKEIVNKTIYKAKELNMKRNLVKFLNKEVDQYLQIVPDYLEKDPHILFPLRKTLLEQFSRLQNTTSAFLDQKSYNKFVETGWFFHLPSGPLTAAEECARKVGSFVYTNGKIAQDKPGLNLTPKPTDPPKPGPLYEILVGLCKNEIKDELKDLDVVDNGGPNSSSSNGQGPNSKLDPSVSNEFDMENDLGDGDIISLDEIMSLVDSPEMADNHGLSRDTEDLISRLNSNLGRHGNASQTQPTVSPLRVNTSVGRGLEEDIKGNYSKEKKTRTEFLNEIQETEMDDEELEYERKGSRSRSSKSSSASPSRPPVLTRNTSMSPGYEARQKRENRGRKSRQSDDDEPSPKGSSGATKAKRGRKRVGKKTVDVEQKPKKTRRGKNKKDTVEEEAVASSVSENSDEEVKTPKPSTSTFKKPRGPQKKTSSSPATGAKRGRKKVEKPADFSLELLGFPSIVNDKMKITLDDPNEDYCSICLDGGDDLICCDYCPKVFHINCHVPVVSAIPPESAVWQCFFCTKLEELNQLSNDVENFIAYPDNTGISKVDFIYACKFVTEVFKSKGSLIVRGYFEKNFRIHNGIEPVHLNNIRGRLTMLKPNPFENIDELILMIRKMLYQGNIFYHGNVECESTMTSFEEDCQEVLALYYPTKLDIDYVPDYSEPAIRTFSKPA